MGCLIETLKLDLQVRILLHAPNIQTLVSLLKATPRLCPAFSSAREKILTRVLINTYGAELYPDALAAAKVMMLPKKCLSPSERLRFLRHYDRSQTMTEFRENSLQTSILMCQLHWTLLYHIKRFSRPAIEFIMSCTKGLSGEHECHVKLQAYIRSPLSSVEQIRLRRAFLRFQIYSRLFCDADPSDDEERADFTQRMPSWEVEEIASVYSYITRGIQQTFDLADEYFLSEYVTECGLASTVGGVVDPGEQIFDPREIDSADPTAAGQPHTADSYDIRLRGDIFTKPSIDVALPGDALYRARLKAHMLVSGLCFLRRLFESTGETRLALVSVKDDLGDSLKPPSMKSLLDYSLASERVSPNDKDTNSSPGSLRLVSPESSKQPTLTWQWAHAQNASGDLRTGIYHELRRWGYVFWSLRRMRRSGILEQRWVNEDRALVAQLEHKLSEWID